MVEVGALLVCKFCLWWVRRYVGYWFSLSEILFHRTNVDGNELVLSVEVGNECGWCYYTFNILLTLQGRLVIRHHSSLCIVTVVESW